MVVAAYVIPRPGTALTPDAVRAYARQHLASYKAPRIVYLVDDLPRTRNGKVLRRELRPPGEGVDQGHALELRASRPRSRQGCLHAARLIESPAGSAGGSPAALARRRITTTLRSPHEQKRRPQ